jgi:hypothetical protein
MRVKSDRCVSLVPHRKTPRIQNDQAGPKTNGSPRHRMSQKPFLNAVRRQLTLDTTSQLWLDTVRVHRRALADDARVEMRGEEWMPVQSEGLRYEGPSSRHAGDGRLGISRCRRGCVLVNTLPARAHRLAEPRIDTLIRAFVPWPAGALRQAGCRTGNAERGTLCALVVQERASARVPQRRRRRWTGAPDLEPPAPEGAR